MKTIEDWWKRTSLPRLEEGAGLFVAIVLVIFAVCFAAYVLWLFATVLVVPAFLLAGTIASEVLSGAPSGGLVDLGTDLVWGVGVGLFVGWVRWQRRKRSGAAEAVVEAAASPAVVSSISLGWRYVFLHVGAGLAASLVVWLLGLAFPSQVIGDGADATHAGIEFLRRCGWFAGPGGGPGGTERGAGLLLFVLLVLLLVIIPLLAGSLCAFTAICLEGAASGATGGAGKGAGLTLFLVLTRLRGTFSLPRSPSPELPPEWLSSLGPLDLDLVIKDFIGTGPPGRETDVRNYLAWLAEEGIKVDARSIGENAPRYKNSVVYDLARRVNYEVARRDPSRESRYMKEARSRYEWQLRVELFGSGWLRRAILQGLEAGVFPGLLTALLVAGGLAVLSRN